MDTLAFQSSEPSFSQIYHLDYTFHSQKASIVNTCWWCISGVDQQHQSRCSWGHIHSRKMSEHQEKASTLKSRPQPQLNLINHMLPVCTYHRRSSTTDFLHIRRCLHATYFLSAKSNLLISPVISLDFYIFWIFLFTTHYKSNSTKTNCWFLNCSSDIKLNHKVSSPPPNETICTGSSIIFWVLYFLSWREMFRLTA